MSREDLTKFAHLLKEGETVAKVDVYTESVGTGDECIVRHDGINKLFDRPVRVRIHGVSSVGTYAIEMLTTDVCYPESGKRWHEDDYRFWFDLNFDLYLITPADATNYPVTVVRIDTDKRFLQGPYTFNVERETDEFWVGRSERGRRFWRKDEWKIQAK